jgi:hypothetical protein
MAEQAGLGEKRTLRLVEMAFPDDQVPAELSVAIVSLVELCQIAMPDVKEIRKRLSEAQFEVGKDKEAEDAARMLALDNKVIDGKLRNFKHTMYGRERQGAPVIFLLSEADSDNGKIVFLTTLFRGAGEADAIKAAMHVIKGQPITGGKVRNADGHQLRRVFWDTKGEGNVRGFMVTGPQHVEADTVPRAFTAFNWVKK